MNKKGAIELSTSFVIGMFIGIVLFSLGLVFLYSILKGTEELEGVLPDSFKIEVENCVQRNERVCVPIIKKEIKSNKVGTFGLIINNVYGEPKKFKPYITYSTGILEDGSQAALQDFSEWTLRDFSVYELENNEYEVVNIPFKVPPGTKAGSYVFNVNVCFNADTNIEETKCPDSDFPSLYGLTHQITIEVP